MSQAVKHLTCDEPIENLQGVLTNLDLASDTLRHLRDRIVEDPHPLLTDASGVIGLYLAYVDRLIAKGRQLAGIV